MKPKALIFVEVDVVVRHFLHNGSFDALARDFDLTFVFNTPRHKRLTGVDPAALDLPGDYVVLPVPDDRSVLWKRLFLTDRLRWRRGDQARALRSFFRKNLGWKASLELGTYALPGVFQLFRWLTLQRLRSHANTALDELIARERAAVLIHPCVMEGMYINDVIEAGKRLAIPSVIIMNSWDNPSTKQSMVCAPDWLLVWGPQTQAHAVEYAGIDIERVVPFGTAQFEVYRTEPRIDRAAFCERNGLKLDHKILLYAGSSTGTAEIEHLALLNRAIAEGELPGNTIILYRPHPWGGGGARGEQLLDTDWPHVVIESTMRVYLEKVRSGTAEKFLSDYRDTHDVLSNIDALISPLSTIIVEGALHRKPVMCFMPLEDSSSHFRHNASFRHFREMIDMPEFNTTFGLASLVPGARKLLAATDDEVHKDKLEAACEFFVSRFDTPYSERLAVFLKDMVLADQELT